MDSPIDAKRVYLEAMAGAALPGQAHAWVQALRDRARTSFDAIGFPTTRHEDWKYTNLASVVRQAFQPALAATVTREQLSASLLTGQTAHQLVFVNGRYNAALSNPPSFGKNGFAGSLAEALATSPDRLSAYLGQVAPIDKHPLAALNTAFLVDGACIHVPAGTVVEQPIHLVYVGTNDALAQPHNLIVAEAGSQVTVIEHYIGIDGARYFTNAVTEAVVERGATLEHYRLQQESAQGFHVGGVYVRQDSTSRFVSHAVDIGGLLVRNDLRTVVADSAECLLDGLYVIAGRQHVDNHTLIDHAQPRGVSREHYKGVLEGRSRAVFNGRVIVQPNAQRIDAQQLNNNLLLSEDAEVDTKPEFEIYADDVKCGHGATVGQLDPDELFYLRSRALDEAAARDLLTFAFAEDILRRFRLAPIRQALEQTLTTRLLHGRQLKEIELI